DDAEYFENYFDVHRDYSETVRAADATGNEFLKTAAERGKGIRILKQNAEETLFSFIVSQNNNIPRIKGIIERLCRVLGEERKFDGKTYESFPEAARIAKESADFYRSAGLGYRAEYFPAVADALLHGFDLGKAATLSTSDLKKELMKLKGVGPKVADCVALFGFNRSDSFPVDTWMEKIYREDFRGELTDRNKFAEYFVSAYGTDAGFFQQYMFHYKRNAV
ncbi:MAG: 8-oxoguanine DNA glycosylase, partial [Clostridia bacterium]|nr:8-oxoguanine DNA glycosylase [Clostridia bacterium]